MVAKSEGPGKKNLSFAGPETFSRFPVTTPCPGGLTIIGQLARDGQRKIEEGSQYFANFDDYKELEDHKVT